MAEDIPSLPAQAETTPPNYTLFVENAQLKQLVAELDHENRVLRAELRQRSLTAP